MQPIISPNFFYVVVSSEWEKVKKWRRLYQEQYPQFMKSSELFVDVGIDEAIPEQFRTNYEAIPEQFRTNYSSLIA